MEAIPGQETKIPCTFLLGLPGSRAGKKKKKFICNTGNPDSNPGLGRSAGEG